MPLRPWERSLFFQLLIFVPRESCAAVSVSRRGRREQACKTPEPVLGRDAKGAAGAACPRPSPPPRIPLGRGTVSPCGPGSSFMPPGSIGAGSHPQPSPSCCNGSGSVALPTSPSGSLGSPEPSPQPAETFTHPSSSTKAPAAPPCSSCSALLFACYPMVR